MKHSYYARLYMAQLREQFVHVELEPGFKLTDVFASPRQKVAINPAYHLNQDIHLYGNESNVSNVIGRVREISHLAKGEYMVSFERTYALSDTLFWKEQL